MEKLYGEIIWRNYMNMIFVDKIIIYSGGNNEVEFDISNTVNKKFGVVKDTITLICDKAANLVDIINYLKSNRRCIAEIEYKKKSQYFLHSINMMSIE